MINLNRLLELQGMMFLLIIIGIILKKKNVVTNEGKRVITDLLINVILPCNIINSFCVEFNKDILIGFLKIFVIAILIQLGCLLISKIIYNWTSEEKKSVLQYATLCSNAGFLGNPIAENVYGSQGLAYASIYLIPQRIVMWTAGISCFTKARGKSVVKTVLTHPCIIAVAVGLTIMIFQIPLPLFIQNTVKSLGGCTMAISMILIGTILSEVNFFSVVNKMSIFYTVVRLVLIPFLVFIFCMIFHIDQLTTGVAVVLAGMPAGSTTAILAAQYEGDAIFASKCVVLSTVLSIITVPIWCWMINAAMR